MNTRFIKSLLQKIPVVNSIYYECRLIYSALRNEPLTVARYTFTGAGMGTLLGSGSALGAAAGMSSHIGNKFMAIHTKALNCTLIEPYPLADRLPRNYPKCDNPEDVNTIYKLVKMDYINNESSIYHAGAIAWVGTALLGAGLGFLAAAHDIEEKLHLVEIEDKKEELRRCKR